MKRSGIVVFSAIFLILVSSWTTVSADDGGKMQIVEVQVEVHNRYEGTLNLLEEVRHRTQNVAYRMSEEGTEKKLRILLRILKVSSSNRALMTSGSSSLRVTAMLIDKKTNMVEKRFKARSRIFRLAGIVGAIAIGASDISHVREEKRLAELLAKRLMTTIYGKDHWTSAKDRQPTRTATANYPMTWEDAFAKYQCDQHRSGGFWAATPTNEEEAAAGTAEREVPLSCSKYPARAKLDKTEPVQITDVTVEALAGLNVTGPLANEFHQLTENSLRKVNRTGVKKRLRVLLKLINLPDPEASRAKSYLTLNAVLIDEATGRIQTRYKVKSRIPVKGTASADEITRIAGANGKSIQRHLIALVVPKLVAKIYADRR